MGARSPGVFARRFPAPERRASDPFAYHRGVSPLDYLGVHIPTIV